MHTSDSLPCPSTRDRLVVAAADLFARDGLLGATTREIAKHAGVNEVTLFRIFKNKEALVAAVVDRLSRETEFAREDAPAASTQTAREAIERFVREYHALLSEHLPLIRTLIGEIHRHEGQEAIAVRGIFGPQRRELVAALEAARKRDKIPSRFHPAIVADQLAGMIFGHVLRRNSAFARDYEDDAFMKQCVDLVCSALEGQ